MIKKYYSPKSLILLIFFIVLGSVLVKVNYFKFKAYYSKYSYLWLTINFVKNKNLKTQELLNNNKIFFEKKEYKYLKFPLDKYGVFFREKYIHRPIGYLDVYKDRIILVTYDGSIFYSNNINEIKNNNLSLNKINVLNYDFDFDYEDKINYRNIKIRDILVDEDKLYIVTNGRQKIDPSLKTGGILDMNFHGSTNILVGKLNLDETNIKLENFFSPGKEKYIVADWSHTGGRLVKYKNSSFLLTVPDYEIEYEKMRELINSDKSTIGKILLIKNGKSKIFSYGHRNPQGLFYDQENDLIFETEHGPQGGDEINLVKYKKHYGFPDASYGTKGAALDKFRNHKKNGFAEPLAYWWPFNCGMSEIIKVDNSFNEKWKNYTLLNACLSGSYNRGESIYRWEFDIEKEKLIKKNKYHIGDRIRDIKYIKEKKILLMLVENQRSLILIFE